MRNNIKPVAIHLPQFHPFPENDTWWGKGFTEWTNVTKAKPLFKGHHQPHLPADLGFYDLRLEEARLAQIAMAREFGIFGFCYYHYWFNGKRLMQEPLDRMRANTREDFPYMLCWANENWTRSWDGQEKEILIAQQYSAKDDTNHIRFLCENFFNDNRYIKVDNKPAFLFYRPQLLPNIKQTIDTWREESFKLGHGELYLGYSQSFGYSPDPKDLGFDFAIEFHPNFGNLPSQEFAPFLEKIRYKLNIGGKHFYENRIIDYRKYVHKQVSKGFQDGVYPGLTPGWDNSARRKSGSTIFINSNPTDYGSWLKYILTNYPWSKEDKNFLFINAWNEWAEGNHLEPCRKWGLDFLKTTRDALSNA